MYVNVVSDIALRIFEQIPNIDIKKPKRSFFIVLSFCFLISRMYWQLVPNHYLTFPRFLSRFFCLKKIFGNWEQSSVNRSTT